MTVTLDAIATLCVLQGWKEGRYLDCAQYDKGGTKTRRLNGAERERKFRAKPKIKIADQRVGS